MIGVSASFIIWLFFVFLIVKLEKIRKANFEVQLISSEKVSMNGFEMKEIGDEHDAPEILEKTFLEEF